MKTPTPHTPKNSQNQTPSTSGRGLGGGLSQQMKPIEISDKLRERVRKLREQLPEMGPKIQALVDEDKKRKQEELEKLKQQEYIEINGIRLETENLGRPQNPEIEINPIKASETIPQAWENNGNWYYNFPGAQAEAQYLGKTIPTKEQWEQICEPFGQNGERLSKELNLPINGIRDSNDGIYYCKGEYGYYWSSSPKATNQFYLYFSNYNIQYINHNNCTHGFSVRCIYNPELEYDYDIPF